MYRDGTWHQSLRGNTQLLFITQAAFAVSDARFSIFRFVQHSLVNHIHPLLINAVRKIGVFSKICDGISKSWKLTELWRGGGGRAAGKLPDELDQFLELFPLKRFGTSMI